MYTEDEERRSHPLRDFLLRLILIIIFVILLVWLLPIPNLKGINNRIFNANVQEMKDAAISYFTTDRLPKNEGDSVTLTLKEMLNMKLLLPFTDKNGDSCDENNSYVTITKMKDEYELKVFLKCGSESDYIIVHLGCYSYCEDAICEKQEEKGSESTYKSNGGKTGYEEPTPAPVTGPKCSLTVSGTTGENGWYIGNATVKFKSKTTTTNGATIKAYGLGTSTNYSNNTSYVFSNDGTTKVYGYVKDSNGKTAVCSVVVKKDTKEPSCSLDIIEGTKNSDGEFITDVKVGFASKNDSTSGISKFGIAESSNVSYNSKSNLTITDNGTHTVYGYVKDNAGKTAVCSTKFTKAKVETSKVSEPSCSLSLSGTKGNNNWYVSDVQIGFDSKSSTNGAKITSYGLGTSQTYNGNGSYTISKDGTYTIHGYVKDSNGNTAVCSTTVKRDATKPSCSLDATGTKKDDVYTSDIKIGFASKSDNMSGINSYGIGKSTTYANNSTYNISVAGTHIVYGYVKDNAGNTNTCSISATKKDQTIEYEYKKTTTDKYGEWSEWKTSTYTKDAAPTFEKTNTKEVVDLGGVKKLTGYKYTVGEPIFGTINEKVLENVEKTCKGYNYYRLSTSTTTTYAVKVAENDGWVYQGTVVSATQPAPDTLAKKYVPYGMDYSSCGETCESAPLIKWKVYTREVSTVTASDTITSSKGVKVQCSEYETKTSYVYAKVSKVIGYKENRTPVYSTVYSYKYRTRTLIEKASTTYKWSTTMNDATLINDGYKLTGKTRVQG